MKVKITAKIDANGTNIISNPIFTGINGNIGEDIGSNNHVNNGEDGSINIITNCNISIL